MKVLNHVVEFSSNARWPITRIIFERSYHRKTLAWWKFVLRFGPMCHCESCDKEVGLYSRPNLCDECYEYNYCECGQRLEDSYGSPGDGFCRKCD